MSREITCDGVYIYMMGDANGEDSNQLGVIWAFNLVTSCWRKITFDAPADFDQMFAIGRLVIRG